MTCLDAKIRFIEALRALYLSSPIEKANVRGWYEASRPFEAMLRTEATFLEANDYHFLWHYLADADIRAKDEVYREVQQGRVAEIIRTLENGSQPVDAA